MRNLSRRPPVRVLFVVAAASFSAIAGGNAARADDNPFTIAGKIAGNVASTETEREVNRRLQSEARRNQCSFKTDTDELAPGCNAKLKNLANVLVDAKRSLAAGGVHAFKFEVSGHTDSRGTAAHNQELSAKRAAVIARELVARGVPEGDIVSVGKGSSEPLATPDNTPAKQAKNRRYELRVRL